MDLTALAEGIRIGRLIQQAADLVRNDIVLKQNERRFLEQIKAVDPEVGRDHYYLLLAWILSDQFTKSSVLEDFASKERLLYDIKELIRIFIEDIGSGTRVPN